MPTNPQGKRKKERKIERKKEIKKSFLLNTEQSAKNDHKIPLNIAKHHKIGPYSFCTFCEMNKLEYIKKT